MPNRSEWNTIRAPTSGFTTTANGTRDQNDNESGGMVRWKSDEEGAAMRACKGWLTRISLRHDILVHEQSEERSQITSHANDAVHERRLYEPNSRAPPTSPIPLRLDFRDDLVERQHENDDVE